MGKRYNGYRYTQSDSDGSTYTGQLYEVISGTAGNNQTGFEETTATTGSGLYGRTGSGNNSVFFQLEASGDVQYTYVDSNGDTQVYEGDRYSLNYVETGSQEYSGTRFTRSNNSNYRMITWTGLYGQSFAQNGYSWDDVSEFYWREGTTTGGGTGQTFLDAFIQDYNPYNLTENGDTTGDSNEMLDPERMGSISLTFTYFDEDSGDTFPVTNGNSVGLYKVANAVVDNGFKYEVDERFASAAKIPSTTEELDSANLELAKELAGIAADYDYDKQPKKMNNEGRVYFDGLTVGLYLVVQDAKGTGDDEFTTQPFLISVPYRNPDGSLNYDVSGDSKPLSIVKENSNEQKGSDDRHRANKLPQTGQLWWPVMVLGAAGALFVLAGLVRRYRN